MSPVSEDHDLNRKAEISGFTFCRNAVKYVYPRWSIKSALPLCDEFIVNVGRCDGTSNRSVDRGSQDQNRQWYGMNRCAKRLIYSQQTTSRSVTLYGRL